MAFVSKQIKIGEPKIIFSCNKRSPTNFFLTFPFDPRAGVYFVTFLVMRSPENFKNERKFYALEKYKIKLWAKGKPL